MQSFTILCELFGLIDWATSMFNSSTYAYIGKCIPNGQIST